MSSGVVPQAFQRFFHRNPITFAMNDAPLITRKKFKNQHGLIDKLGKLLYNTRREWKIIGVNGEARCALSGFSFLLL